MSENRQRKTPHRGRRRKKEKKGKASVVSNIILILAIVVFAVSAFQLIKIGKGYLEGRSEYKKVGKLAIENAKAKPEDEKDQFKVNFDELMKLNKDTVAWIRFYPEPSIISYPVVQGSDNEKYLHKTFTEGENTMGTIFVNVDNKPDFTDKNTIIYGHRMKDGSMFRHLQDYEDKTFLEANPYFYLYTPDGKMITYQIFVTGTVKDTAEVYTTQFESDEVFSTFINNIKGTSAYDTDVEVKPDSTIVTLSTCTAASDDNRIVICGVKVDESKVGE